MSANLHRDDEQYAILAATAVLLERAPDVPVRWREMRSRCGLNTRQHAKEQPMIKMRRPYVLPMHPLICLALLAVVPGHVFARDPSVAMPEHASANRYGSGWECDRGYREANGACIAVKVPADAYATNASYGPGWECNWGYREVDETCAAIKVPPNAYLTNASYGSGCGSAIEATERPGRLVSR